MFAESSYLFEISVVNLLTLLESNITNLFFLNTSFVHSISQNCIPQWIYWLQHWKPIDFRKVKLIENKFLRLSFILIFVLSLYKLEIIELCFEQAISFVFIVWVKKSLFFSPSLYSPTDSYHLTHFHPSFLSILSCKFLFFWLSSSFFVK